LFPQVYFALNEGVIRGYEPISKKKRCNTGMKAVQPLSMLALGKIPRLKISEGS